MDRHLFVSRRGDLLPRWCEAFPGARAARPGTPAAAGVDLVWVRLPDDGPPAVALAQARNASGNLPLVALSDRPEDDEALACLAAGARGYCNSHAQPELLRQVAAVVQAGGLWIGEALMLRLLQGTARRAVPAPADEGWAATLTERERQVARAVAAGASNKEIARQLGITERTVKAHVGAMFEKLGVRDRLQLSLRVLGRHGD